MAVIGVIADDYTGTASSGVLVARSGAKTGLFFDTDALQSFSRAEELDAIYVSSNSRNLKAKNAYDEVVRATNALKDMNIKFFSKKIDTTLRGGIGIEIDAMLDTLEEDMIGVVITAMPQSRRICIGGYSIIDGVILTETTVVNDVKTPVKESFVPDLIKSQTKRKVELLTLKVVLAGESVLKKQMEEAIRNGCEILIIDAVTLEHIDLIAKVCVNLKQDILAVDPGAFTMKLAYRRGVTQEEKSNVPEVVCSDKGKVVLAMIGSANPATKAQVEVLYKDSADNVLVSVSPKALVGGGEVAQNEVDRAIQTIIKLLKQHQKPRAIIVETALHNVMNLQEEDEKHGYEAGESSKFINEGLALITKGVLAIVGREHIAGLFLSGGDTMECICREIEVECIEAIDNIVAQVDIGRIIGKYNGMPVIVKGGFCGSSDIGIQIVDRLLLESARKE